jgi:hypothetical protein
MRATCRVLLLLSLAPIAGAWGQTRLGSEFQINSKTELTQYQQRLAVGQDGGFAVAWIDARGEFTPYKPFAVVRFFDPEGNPVGREQDLPSEAAGQPFVLARPDGGFRVLWGGYRGNSLSLFLQDFSPAGAPLRDAYVVPLPDPNGMGLTNVVATPKQRILLSWLSRDTAKEYVRAARLSRQGVQFGKTLPIAEDPVDHLYRGGVGVDAKGNAVVVWTGECGPYGEGSHCDVFAQRLGAMGGKLGRPFRVNTRTRGLQEDVSVAVAPDGGFLVIWYSVPDFPHPSSIDVFAQRYSAAGLPLGGEIKVNSDEKTGTLYPVVSVDPSGQYYVVIWARVEPEQGHYGHNLYGRILRSDGTKVGEEFRVNTRNTFNESPQPRVAFGGNGTFVVVWNASDGDFDGVFGQRFSIDGLDGH